MVNFGYPYNDIVICKDSTDYLEKLYNPALFREHFHQYFEMLLHAKLLNLKTFHLCKIKDFLDWLALHLKFGSVYFQQFGGISRPHVDQLQI